MDSTWDVVAAQIMAQGRRDTVNDRRSAINVRLRPATPVQDRQGIRCFFFAIGEGFVASKIAIAAPDCL